MGFPGLSLSSRIVLMEAHRIPTIGNVRNATGHTNDSAGDHADHKTVILWVVASFISHHLETMVETIRFVGICRGIESFPWVS